MPSLAQHRRRRSLGLCVICEVPTNGKARCNNCLIKQRSYYANTRARRKENKQCVNCGRSAKVGQTKCSKCFDVTRAAAKQQRRRLRADGCCFGCRKQSDNPGRDCSSCCAARREQYRQLRNEVFAAYGGYRCNCCGESEPDFLQIDHIDGNGGQHRKAIGQGRTYRWLKQNNFPPGFQVLCANCNFSKGHYGSCPHTRQSLPP
jgi:hypothetical protein